jgi:hypothetical protein
MNQPNEMEVSIGLAAGKLAEVLAGGYLAFLFLSGSVMGDAPAPARVIVAAIPFGMGFAAARLGLRRPIARLAIGIVRLFSAPPDLHNAPPDYSHRAATSTPRTLSPSDLEIYLHANKQGVHRGHMTIRGEGGDRKYEIHLGPGADTNTQKALTGFWGLNANFDSLKQRPDRNLQRKLDAVARWSGYAPGERDRALVVANEERILGALESYFVENRAPEELKAAFEEIGLRH